MIKYALNEDLITGNAMIDAQHKELFDAVNNLLGACAIGKGRETLGPTFKFLQTYITKHFNDEERLQLSVSYPGYIQHKNFHELYKKKIEHLSALFYNDGATISVLGNFNQEISTLINHIRIEDKKIANFIKANKEIIK